MAERITKNLTEIGATALDLLTGRYPSFVYGADIRPGQIPIFCFHSAEPDLFEQQLAFLSANGYATLTADEYLSAMRGDTVPPPRSVMLTFDDGWGSLWSIGYPILRKYGIKIVVFLIPGRIESLSGCSPNLIDLQEGRCRPEEVYDRDASEHPLLTWEEISRMHESGLVDFQSHTYSHTLVYRSPRIVDFVHPAMLRSYNLLELPNPGRQWQPAVCPPIRLGEPLYESAPRLSDEWRVFLPESIGDECASLAEEYGPDFFERPDWRSDLWRVVQKHRMTAGDVTVETNAEHSAAIWLELLASRRSIEEHLPGKAVRHICYPWHAAGRRALAMASEAGYDAGYLGKVDGRYYSRGSAGPLRTARVGADYFFRLPGRGRAPLLRTLFGKFARRIRQGSPYLTH